MTSYSLPKGGLISHKAGQKGSFCETEYRTQWMGWAMLVLLSTYYVSSAMDIKSHIQYDQETWKLTEEAPTQRIRKLYEMHKEWENCIRRHFQSVFERMLITTKWRKELLYQKHLDIIIPASYFVDINKLSLKLYGEGKTSEQLMQYWTRRTMLED